MEERKLIVPGIYRHFKNKYYVTMGIIKPVEGEIIHELIGKPNVITFEAEHTETGDIILIVRHKKIFYISNKYVKDTVVLYKSLYDDHIPYIRPLTMFTSEVDRKKYPNVKQKYRFEYTGGIQLKNIDLSNATLDELFDEVIEKNEECKYALTNLIELIKCNVNKEYLKEHYIEKILDQLQANINIASAYGITANDIMKYYNTKYLEKLKK